MALYLQNFYDSTNLIPVAVILDRILILLDVVVEAAGRSALVQRHLVDLLLEQKFGGHGAIIEAAVRVEAAAQVT
jgi:hypothetical protein